MKIYLLLISMLTSHICIAEIDTLNELKQKVDKLRQDQNIPGLAITTFTKDGAQYSLASGHTNIGKSSLFSSTLTLTPIASVSKIFTSVSAYDLIDKGFFNLNTKLSSFRKARFYKSVSLNCPEKLNVLSQVTIADLLSHRSGLVQDLPTANMWWNLSSIQDGLYPSWETFDNGVCKINLVFKPGSNVKYSNLGYNLLYQIITSFEESIENIVLDPLMMDKTRYGLSSREAQSMLTSTYSSAGIELPKILSPLSYAGSIGVNSTSSDLAKLGREMLSWMSSQKSYYRFMKNDFPKFLNPKSSLNSAISWSNGILLFDTKNSEYSEHNNGYICYGFIGTGYGSRALLYACPELNWGMSAVFNARSANRESFLWAISNTLLKKQEIKRVDNQSEQLKTWLKKVRSFKSSFRPIKKPSFQIIDNNNAPKSLRKYLGVYNSDLGGDISIQVSSNNKLVFFGHELKRISKNVFQLPAEAGVYFSFEKVKFIEKDSKIVQINAAEVLYADKK